jgi:hypothetical protein
MNLKSIFRDTGNLAKIATIIIFLALIRCISEPFRLQHYSKTTLRYTDLKPFLIGSLIAAIGLLIMTILSYFNKPKLIIVTCIVIIIILLCVKKIYLLP